VGSHRCCWRYPEQIFEQTCNFPLDLSQPCLYISKLFKNQKRMEIRMYAVIKTGGKQYKVTEGEFLKVEKLDGEIGDSIEFAEILMVGGETTVVGAPLVAGASVTAKIAAQGKGKKVLVFKSKKRKDSRKLRGHRQHLTVLKIEKITA
jgi:large subunit ribosomal protein L21